MLYLLGRRRMKESYVSNTENYSGGGEDLATLPADGLTVYVSCFSSASYPDTGGKLWTNVAPASTTADRAFHFASSPAFSRSDGFALGRNVVTGPYSFQLGIRADAAFTILLLCQFSGDLPSAGAETSLFTLFANTKGNNGISLSAYNASPPSSSSTITTTATPSPLLTLGLRLRYGDAAPIECAPPGADLGLPGARGLAVDPAHKYLLMVTHATNGHIGVRVLDVQARHADIIMLADVKQQQDTVVFSNKDMTLNGDGTWDAQLQAFGIYSRVLGTRDALTLYDHYRTQYMQYDPTYVALSRQIAQLREEDARLRGERDAAADAAVRAAAEAEASRAAVEASAAAAAAAASAAAMKKEERAAEKAAECPYDVATCAACGGVTDWSDPQMQAGSGEMCKASVGAYCEKRATSDSRCRCWDRGSAAYATGDCSAYRCLFGADCASSSAAAAAAAAAAASNNNNNNNNPPPLSSAAMRAEMHAIMANLLEEEVANMGLRAEESREKTKLASQQQI